MRLVLACAVFAACGDNALGPPLVPSGDVVVVAHQDDDLLFMQPDLAERVTAHEPTTIVYVTAGDAGAGLAYAMGRINASKAAYSVVTGVSFSDWECGWIEIDGHDAEHCRLDGANLSLVFLGYPDGEITGSAPTSLLNLWEGHITRVETVAEFRATYERGDLIATIGAILDATEPTTIRTLEIAATHGSDHSDHMLVGTLTLLAALQTGSTAQLLSYRGYNTNYEPPTVTDDGMFALTSLPMRAYEACALACDGVCSVTPCSTLSDPRYVGFAARRYAVANRTMPQSGILSTPDGCLVEAATAPGGVSIRAAGRALALGSCDDAVTIELEPGGLVALDGGCLQVQPDHSLAIGECELSPERAFAFDDEGHLWSGLPADPQAGMDVMHDTCVAGDASGVHLELCGASNDARWDLVRTPEVTPRRVPGTTNNAGRAIRIGDMTGDGLADMCTATPKGLVCGVGDGTGGFATPVHVGPASFQIQPQSLALGDVDGDGLPDACGRTTAGIVCETSSTGYLPQAWSSEFAASGSASASDRSLAIIQGSVCGASADGVVCVNGEVESILTGWPGTAGAPVWPADLDGDTDPDWCSATSEGVQCGLAAEQTITDSGQSWGFSIDDVVQGSVASDGTLDDTVHSAIADVSGDGRGDMCVAIGDRVECAVGQGHGFGPRHLALVMPTHKPIIGLWLGDLDGDGKADPCADDGGVIACSLSP